MILPKLLVRNGLLIDPANNKEKIADLFIENGRIKRIGKNLSKQGATVLEAEGLTVCPGLIDMHVHLREPGREDEETVITGTRAAAKGGFTSVVCMANTQPPADNKSVLDYIRARAEEEGMVRVYPAGAVTKGLKGEELAEMAELTAAGAVAFSDDGEPIMNAEIMRRALEYAKMLNRPLVSHAEDRNLSLGGQINEGYHSTLLGMRGIPAAAEEAIVARDLLLSELTGAKLHIAHVSTKGSIEMIKRAKKRGIPVTCEVTPHHLTLTDEALLTFDTNYKVNPPLRSREDLEALRKGLVEGIIDAIATDHAPHALEEKEKEFDYAPFGIVGLQTALPLIITELVERGVLTLTQAIAKMSLNPAKILSIPGGSLEEGSIADLIAIDHKAEVNLHSFGGSKPEVNVDNWESKSRNCPYFGWKLHGKVIHMVVDGKVVVKDGRIVEKKAHIKPVKGKRSSLSIKSET